MSPRAVSRVGRRESPGAELPGGFGRSSLIQSPWGIPRVRRPFTLSPKPPRPAPPGGGPSAGSTRRPEMRSHRGSWLGSWLLASGFVLMPAVSVDRPRPARVRPRPVLALQLAVRPLCLADRPGRPGGRPGRGDHAARRDPGGQPVPGLPGGSARGRAEHSATAPTSACPTTVRPSTPTTTPGAAGLASTGPTPGPTQPSSRPSGRSPRSISPTTRSAIRPGEPS